MNSLFLLHGAYPLEFYQLIQLSNPFDQVQDCVFALKDHLADIYSKHSEEANITVGYAVVFPECIFIGKGNDLQTEVMFDSSKNVGDFSAFLEKTLDFWEQPKFPQNYITLAVKHCNSSKPPRTENHTYGGVSRG